MELIFVRHGHAEHMESIPDSYKIANPGLTQKGMEEAALLKIEIPLTEQDAVIASPTRRALQTAQLWCFGTNAARFIHPAVGPRQYPSRYDFTTMPCDLTLEPLQLIERYSEFLLPSDVPAYLWLQGINTVPALLFENWADQFIAWCKKLDKSKVHIISHEGTIASYLEYLCRGKAGLGGKPDQSGDRDDSSGWTALSV